MAKMELVTAPTGTGLVVSPQELMDHSRIKVHREDALIRRLLREAQEEAERFTWRRFLKQVWKQYWDQFDDPLYLRFPPLHSDGVDPLQYTDTNETTQTVATSVYETGEMNGFPVIRRKYNQTWPTPLGHEDVVWAQFTCGWDTADDVPEPIHAAIRINTAWHFRHREAGDPTSYAAMSKVFRAKLMPYSIRRPVKIHGQA